MTDTVTVTETDVELEFPSLWGVKFLNDDFTPMDFVVYVLVQFFKQSIEEAASVMMKVHQEGQAVVGAYPKDIAVTKAEDAMRLAVANEHPLRLQPVQV